MKGINNFIWFLLFTVLVSCVKTESKKELLQEDYINEIKNNASLIQEKKIGSISYKLVYKPAEYVMLKENKNIKSEDFKNSLIQYKKMEYYTLEISIKDFNDEVMKYQTASESEYSEKLDYYNFKFQQDIFQVIGNDTTYCQAYYFERNYGLSPKIRFNFAFDASTRQDNRTICVDEKYLNSGTLKFVIDYNTIKALPNLKNTN